MSALAILVAAVAHAQEPSAGPPPAERPAETAPATPVRRAPPDGAEPRAAPAQDAAPTAAPEPRRTPSPAGGAAGPDGPQAPAPPARRPAAVPPAAQPTPRPPAARPAAAPAAPAAPAPPAKPSAAPLPAPPPSPSGGPRPSAPPPPPSPARPSPEPAPPAPAPVPRPAAAPPSPSPPAAARPDPEREEATRVARAFLEALARGDADALASLASERFSFDGDVQSGRDAIRRTWRALVAGRPSPPPQIVRLEVLPVAEMIARHGQPPARVAPLARPGSLVGLGDLSGRPVILFLGREAGRLAVTGMHD